MPRKRGSRIGAAIDIGSNSMHLLVARLAPGAGGGIALTVLDDRSELLGLGATVDTHGGIPRDTRDQIHDTLVSYSALAAEAGARRLTLIGTEPLRRAANSDVVAADVLDTTGHELHVIDVREEAELTFIGVTGGLLPDDPLMVVDVGGGSTEIGLYLPGAALEVVAVPIGSARLTAMIVEHDPPTESELDRLHDAAAEIKRQLPAPMPISDAGRLRAVLVGGTSTNLGRLGRLSRTGLAADRQTLHQLDAVAITELFGVRPQRARQLAAGAAIVDVLLEHFGVDEALVSQASLRDGAIIVEWRYGEDWPTMLVELFTQPPAA